MKKYMYSMAFLAAVNIFGQQQAQQEIPTETTWKEALGYIAIVAASAGMGAACGACDAHYFGPKKDALISGINSISQSKESFKKGFNDLSWNALLPFALASGVTTTMWAATFNARYSLAQGVCEDSKKNWVKRSLGFVSFWSSWAAYIAVYALLRKKNPVGLNINNFKGWD